MKALTAARSWDRAGLSRKSMAGGEGGGPWVLLSLVVSLITSFVVVGVVVSLVMLEATRLSLVVSLITSFVAVVLVVVAFVLLV
jgi:hypothetical protein